MTISFFGGFRLIEGNVYLDLQTGQQHFFFSSSMLSSLLSLLLLYMQNVHVITQQIVFFSLTLVNTYLLTYLLHKAESFLRS